MTEKDFLRAVKGADRSFFQQAAARAADPQGFAAQHGGKRMKSAETTRKIKRAVIGALIAAAVLGGGTIAMSVAMHGHLGGYYKYDGSSIEVTETHEEPITLHLTDEEENPALECRYYTKERRWSGEYAATDWFVETEAGYYSLSFKVSYSDTESRQSRIYCYADKETGETVPLCADPSCLHDGSEYCPASTLAYSKEELFLCDGRLLTIASKSYQQKTDYGTEVCVLEYAPDGSGITQLAKFDFGLNNCTYTVKDVCRHRGYLFALIEIHRSAFTEGADGKQSSHEYTGSAVVCYELATGQPAVIHQVDPEASNAQKRFSSDVIWGRGDQLWGTEKYLDLNTFELHNTSFSGSNAISPTHDSVFWLDQVPDGSKLMRYDYETDKDTEIKRGHLRPEQREGFNYDFHWHYVFADDSYLYVGYSEDDPTSEEWNPKWYLMILDHDAQLIAKVPMPAVPDYPNDIVSDGTYLYYTLMDNSPCEDVEAGLYRIKIADMLDGESAPETWEKMFDSLYISEDQSTHK